jgi:hypothetical protein
MAFDEAGQDRPRQMDEEQSHSDLLRACRAAVRDYEENLRWPVHTDGAIVWMAPGIVADALNVPRGTGEQAVERLRDQGVHVPAVAIPGPPARLALLTLPHPGPALDVLARLVLHRPAADPASGIAAVDLGRTARPSATRARDRLGRGAGGPRWRTT